MRIIVSNSSSPSNEGLSANSDHNGSLENNSFDIEDGGQAGNEPDRTSDVIPRKKTRKCLPVRNDVEEGYNSSDEYGGRSFQSNKSLYDEFCYELESKKGFYIKRMAEDGNCLFRSVADQIYGDAEMHDQIRERCMAYMRAERDHFSQFVTEDFQDYIERKSKDRSYGNNLEIQAIGEMFNRPVEIYMFDPDHGITVEPINIFHGQYSTDNPPIRLSYHYGNHYNSVIDPRSATIGVGLGLPNFEPGLADKIQMQKAMEESENVAMDKILFEQSRWESELQETEEEIEQAILQQSQYELEQAVIEQSRREYYNRPRDYQ